MGNSMVPVMSLLWEYVHLRGVEQGKEWWLRRPRTCIYSTHMHSKVPDHCDVCFTVSSKGIGKLPLNFQYEHYRHDASLMLSEVAAKEKAAKAAAEANATSATAGNTSKRDGKPLS